MKKIYNAIKENINEYITKL